MNRLALAKLYGSLNTTDADQCKHQHESKAKLLKAGILDLLWDSKKVCFFFGEFNYQLITTHTPNFFLLVPTSYSLVFMISFSIPTIVVMYFPRPHFIHSGVGLYQTKLLMTKNLHLEPSHLSIW